MKELPNLPIKQKVIFHLINILYLLGVVKGFGLDLVNQKWDIQWGIRDK